MDARRVCFSPSDVRNHRTNWPRKSTRQPRRDGRSYSLMSGPTAACFRSSWRPELEATAKSSPSNRNPKTSGDCGSTSLPIRAFRSAFWPPLLARHQAGRSQSPIIATEEHADATVSGWPLGARERRRGLPGYSALTPERLTTSAHFSVSAAMKVLSSAGVKKIGAHATSRRRLRTAGSARAVLTA